MLSYAMAFWGVEHLSHRRVILIFSFMAMLVHQVEEYGWPGGFPSITNIIVFGEKRDYDRYPFNQRLCFIDNVFTTYAFYIIPIFLPDVAWLGLAQVIAGLYQLPAHGIAVNLRLKSLYNPGLAATLFLQTPLAVYYIWYMSTNNLATGMDFLLGTVGGLVGLALSFGLPVLLMRDRNSKYPFAAEELFGYAEQKAKAMLETMLGNK